MPANHIVASQTAFLLRGGIFEMGLMNLRDAGILPSEYVFHEYPKAITISHGPDVEVTRITETCKGKEISWIEFVRNESVITVASEDEEERVLSGGKTSRQIEDDRMGLLARCHSMGVPADPAWSAVRLRRELGEALDAPAPGDNMAKLEAELVNLRKMAAMREEIALLRAQLDAPDEPGEIAELGTAAERRAAKAAARASA